MRRFLLALSVVLAFETSSQAFEHKVTSATKTGIGPNVVAKISGTYRLAGGERFTNVFVELLDAKGQVKATSQGTINKNTHTWSASGGHYLATQYRALFYVNNPQGTRLLLYRSASYRLR